MDRNFLRWLWIACAASIALLAAYFSGVLHFVLASDPTGICYLILGLLVYSTYRCGKFARWADRISVTADGKGNYGYQLILHRAELGWSCARWCEQLGFIGTAAGLLMIGSVLLNSGASDATAIKQLIESVTRGAMVAFSTTATGLAASLLIQLQYYRLVHRLEELV